MRRGAAAVSSGFTLIELLVVLSVVAMMAALAIPAWRTLLCRQSVNAWVQRVQLALNIARDAAITRQQVVTVCPGHGACGGSWNEGMQVVAAHHKVLQHLGSIPKRYPILWRSSEGRNDAVSFAGNGFTVGQRGSWFVCCNQKPALGRRLVLLNSGRMYVTHLNASGVKLCHVQAQ